MMEHVILVDTSDREIGTMEKMEAHQKGVLHRAFSILLFDDSGRILLQKRAENKYHSSGLWTNTCCSHPLPGESTEEATRRRLMEEMGIDLQPSFSYTFMYREQLHPDLIEHELDHVFFGKYSGAPVINEKEVADWKYADLNWLRADMARHPDAYTVWFKLIVNHPEVSSIPVNS
jgi:isopentenyl-diphosphate Delta-isomerase